MGLTPEQSTQYFDYFKDIYLVGRVGEVSDTSAAIKYSTSDLASFITGTILAVDGGALIAKMPKSQ